MPVIFSRKHFSGGEVSLGNSISQLASYQRGFVPTSPPLFDDIPDEYPVSGGYNLGLTSYERMNNLRRNDSLNLQSNPVHVPRAIRGSPSYSDCSSPSRESHAFFGSARPITNTRSNSPVYADPIYNREFKNSYHQFGPDMTDQQLVNLRKLNALQHASPSSAETSRQQQQSSDVLDMKNLNIVMNIINSSNMNSAQRQQMITTLMNSLTIHQNQQNDQLNPKLSSQSWSPSPPVDNGNNEFNFSVLSSAGSSNGSLYGRNSYYNGNMAIPVEQALFEENARNHRTAQASMKQDNCPCYNGDFPIRENKNPTYSVKVFLGGVPWDITEENLVEDFSRFGRVTVEWPKGVNKGLGMDMNDRKDSQKKGYVYVIFEADKQVKALLAACTQDLSKGPDTLFFPVSSKKFKLKMVQVIPWAICDSNYQKSPHMNLNPKSTVFVGALHGVMHAQFLFNVFDSLFQGVVYAGIDTDKFKYPIGSARVMFNNMKSYMQAVNAQFVDIKTPKFQKTVQVDPYLEDSPCSICHHQQGPYFCKAGSCFNYFCHKCWQVRHPTKTLLHTHQPLMRNSKAGNMAAPSPASALLAHRRALQGQNQASGNMMTSEQGGQSNGPTYRGVTLPAYSDVNGGGDFAAALLNNNNNYYWKNDNAGAGMMNMNAAGAGGDLIRGNLD